MRRYGRFICGGSYIWTKLGPVHLEMKNIFEQDRKTHKIRSLAPVDEREFSESDKKILEMIWNVFGAFL